MKPSNVSADTRALWDVYCLAKARASAPTADAFDAIELEIALDELAQALLKDLSGSVTERYAVVSRATRVRH